MGTDSTARKAALWIVGAVGISSLSAKAIERWADRNGYLDDPTKGLQWLLSAVASVTEFWWFYPALCFFVGLVIGLWWDALLRTRSRGRVAESKSLGYAMKDYAEFLQNRASRSLNPWPGRIADRIPDLQSLLIRIDAAGYWTPPQRILDLNDDGQLLQVYLMFVGTLLADGHFEKARQEALGIQTEFEQAASRVKAR
ncbi:hypothetical protein LJR220_003362 [Bradyrhizobium sp. LjRoot220]|uniref:hypothetical protein n=1 Tax=Bradyrhizobium sp. LjRoot220 TaxID=3342284 RepID=UPI003ECD9D15